MRIYQIFYSLLFLVCLLKISKLEVASDNEGVPLMDEDSKGLLEKQSEKKARFEETMLSTRSIYLSWKLPYFSLRMILQFGQNQNDMSYIQLSSNSRNHTMESLEPGSSYEIILKIYYVSGEIENLKKIVTTVPIFPTHYAGAIQAEIKFIFNNNFQRTSNSIGRFLKSKLEENLQEFKDTTDLHIYSIELLANDQYDVLTYITIANVVTAQGIFYKLRDSLHQLDINHLGFSFAVFPGCCNHVFHHPFDKNYIAEKQKSLLNFKIISDASFVSSKCGHALDISKSDITVKTHGQLPLESITIALYVKLNSIKGLHPIISAINYQTQMRLEIQEGRLVWMYYNLANSQGFIVSTEQVLKSAQWMHVLVDYNSNSGLGRIFLNGQLQQKALSHVLLSNNWMLGLRIGKYFSGGIDYRMNGFIDNLLIFGCVISLKNIQEISKTCGDFKCSQRQNIFQGPKLIQSKEYLEEQDSNLSIDDAVTTKECDAAGTVGRYNHENSAPACNCKVNVEGDGCDKCKLGYFNLNQDNPYGCMPCFCNGLTKNCKSSKLNRKQLVLSAQDIKNLKVTTADKSVTMPKEKLKYNPLTNSITYEIGNQEINNILYWELPLRYCGDKVGSYGGNLRFTVLFLAHPLEKPLYGADVILKGNNLVLHYYEDRQPLPGQQHYYQVILQESFWRTSNGDKVTREELITALAGIDSFLLRATFSTDMIESSLYEVRLDVIDYDTTVTSNSVSSTSMVEECQCPPQYFGSSCQHCNKGYTKNNGSILLGTCVPCQCNGHASDCDGETGECRNCNHFTTGKHCNVCLPGYYGDPRSGRVDACKPCPCPLAIPSNQFSPTCIMGNDGQPTCNACPKEYVGRRCERCDRPYEGIPTKPGDYCKLNKREVRCEGCDLQGTSKCDKTNGRCICKKNVIGSKCSTCVSGSYYLHEDNMYGCINCWCSGVSQSCTSADYYRTNMALNRNDLRWLSLTDVDESVRVSKGFYFTSANELIFNMNENFKNLLYWNLPEKFLKNKITYYGGSIEYAVSFDAPDDRSSFIANDIIIKRGDLKLFHSTNKTVERRNVQTYQAILTEHHWRTMNGELVSRDQFMFLLVRIDAIFLRASYHNKQTFSSLSNLVVKDSIPIKTVFGETRQVERCKCPQGYSGLSCERCSSGYKRTKQSDGKTACVLCECNGHSEHCDGESGKCFHCKHNTAGEYCQYCKRGYYGEPTKGGCKQCACPLLVATNQFSETCSLVKSDGSYQCNSCKRGYAGKICDKCADGYAGNPKTPGGTCKQIVKKYTFSPVVSIFPERRQDRVFTSATFTCTARGESPIKISWSRSDGRPFSDRVSIITKGNSKTLIIKKLELRDQETYICSARNDYGLSSDRAVLFVIGHHLRRIRVSVSPRSLRIEEGADARFVCSDDSQATSTLTWSRDGEKLPENAIVEGGFLTIRNVEKKHSGLYKCTGSNQYSSDVVSAMLTVGVVIKPVVSVSPSYQAVDIGSNTRFRCAATGYPRPTIVWKRGRTGNLPSNIFVEGSTLVVTDVREKDEGEYYCTASNRGGSSSTRAHLYVRADSTLPRASVSSPLANARIGTIAKLKCRSTGTSHVTFKWTRRNGVLSFKADVENGILTIPDISYNDEDVYKCTVQNVYGSSSATVKLMVIAETGEKPTVEMAPTLITTVEGATQYLECNVSGSPPPIILWSKPNGLLTHRHILEENKLFVVNATWEDSGLYTCTGKNKFGQRSATSVVSVRRRLKPTIKIIGITDKIIYAGGRATFKCVVENGIPTPSIYWSNENGYRLPESYVKYIENGVLLKFRKASKNHEGKYSCVGSNIVGTTSKLVTLKIKGDPQVYFKPRGLFEVSVGENVTIECFGKGYPVPALALSHPKLHNLTLHNFQLSRKKGYVKLVFNAQKDTGGLFTCTGVNVLGEKYDKVNVVVSENEMKPIPVVYPTKIETKVGDEVKFHCGARGIPSPTVFWTKNNSSKKISTKNLLLLTSVERTDEGVYICNAKNRRGTARAITTLKVEASPQAEILPGKLTIQKGNSFNLKCIANGYPKPSVSWHFNNVNNDPPSSMLLSQNELISLAISPEDAGVYICKASNIHGEFIASAEINVVEPPNILPANNTVLQVALTENITLVCHVHGYPRPNVRWKFPKKSSGYFKYNKYFITNVSIYDQGQFVCEASNSAGIARETFTVIINELPKVFIEEDSTVTLISGSRKELYCRGFGKPEPTVKWLKVTSGQQNITENILSANGTLILTKVKSSDAGLYRCVASNKYGSVISEVKVFVFSLPVIHIHPSYIETNINERVKFTCDVENAEAARITWRRLNGDLPKEHYAKRDFLLLPKVTPEDGGKYVCHAENSEGSAEEVARLKILEFVPNFSSQENSHMIMNKITDSLYRTKISVSFKSEKPNGLLLYSGNPSKDIISITLQNKFVVFEYNLGSGSAFIRSKDKVRIGEWHTVEVLRAGAIGYVILDNKEKSYGRSQGRFTGLNLEGELYIGGHEDLKLVNKKGFTGCISQVVVNGKKINLGYESLLTQNVSVCRSCDKNPCQNFGKCYPFSGVIGYRCKCPKKFTGTNCEERVERCYPNACKNGGRCVNKRRNGFICKCSLGWQGKTCTQGQTISLPSFNKDSLLSYQIKSAQPGRLSFLITLKLHSITNGTIMYINATSNSYIELSVTKSRIVLLISIDNARLVIEDDNAIVKNEWFQVYVEINGRYVSVSVNGKQAQKGYVEAPNAAFILDANPKLYLGNSKTSFIGCLRQLKVNKINIDLKMDYIAASKISRCYIYLLSPCSSNPCFNGGTCKAVSKKTYTCTCSKWFKGKRCEVAIPRCGDHAQCINNGTCIKRDGKSFCLCPLFFGGKICEKRLVLTESLSLEKESYLFFPREILRRKGVTRIGLTFKTRLNNSLLLWYGDHVTSSPDFFSLGITNNRLEVRYELGSGLAEVSSEKEVNDGKWHSIDLYRKGSFLICKLDRTNIFSVTSPGSNNNLDVKSFLYIGGAEDVAKTTQSKYKHGFVGCIKRFELNGRLVIMTERALGGFNIKPCVK